MSADKYGVSFPEIELFLKATNELFSKMQFTLDYGKLRLEFGMNEWVETDKKPSFDIENPPYPYGEKNLYINASNNLCFSSMWKKVPMALCEIYYGELLKETKIKEAEISRKINEQYFFNKGIAYANLGVAQTSQMKLDEGIANILKALDEDRGYSKGSKPEFDLFRRNLFSQFESWVIDHLFTYISKMSEINIDDVKKFIEDFLEFLSSDQRAFFDYTFMRIIQNLSIWNEKENRFTSGRLLAYIQDLCLFGEDLLKTKGFSGTLNPMISTAFKGIALNNCGGGSLEDLNDNLISHFKEPNLKHRCLKILLTLRNFSSHNIAGGDSKDFFYKNYKDILLHVLQAIVYIYKR